MKPRGPHSSYHPMAKPGPPSGIPARRGRPPKNKKKWLRRVGAGECSEQPAVLAEAGSRGMIQAEQCCDFCGQSPLRNVKGVYEALLFCKDCTAKAHPSCMDYSEELSFRAKKGFWQCIDCKTCCICLDAGDPDLMLFCDGCDKGYHMNCHIPQVLHKPQGKWVCGECTSDGVLVEELERKEKERQIQREKEKEHQRQREEEEDRLPAPQQPPGPLSVSTAYIKQEAGSTLPLTPAASPAADDGGGRGHFDPGAGRKLLSKEPRFVSGSSYPDATDWTISDVSDFLVSAGFAEQAEVFREQEIDGKSLLLMKRSDVLTGMSLKLGPALKIHRHVQKLQLAGMCDSGSRM